MGGIGFEQERGREREREKGRKIYVYIYKTKEHIAVGGSAACFSCYC